MLQMMDGKIVINKYVEQHYSTVFNKSTGLFIRVEENGLGSTVSKIGNLMDNKWFDYSEYFGKNKRWNVHFIMKKGINERKSRRTTNNS